MDSKLLKSRPLGAAINKLLFNPLLFLFFIAQIGSAQNLVVNGGFERSAVNPSAKRKPGIANCHFAGSSDVFDEHALGWKTFNDMTPDLWVWDSVSGCPNLPKPRRGNRMAGLIMYHPFQDGQFAFDYHEFIQGKLAKPMVPGKTYRISFWTYTDDSLGIRHLNDVFGRSTNIKPVRCSNFGFYFSKDKINPYEHFMLSQLDFQVRPQANVEEIVDTKGEWRKISLTFKAGAPYTYFLFGNFFSDAVTDINMEAEARMRFDEENTKPGITFFQKTKRIGYYCFDDFSIVEDTGESIEEALLQQKRYTFQSAFLFETGKSDLKPESLPELQNLVVFLKKNTGTRLEIGGHTDNQGGTELNQKLSEARAEAVIHYLVEKGIPANQVSGRGYGATLPVASNETESGRQQNRRVECRVME